MEELKQILIAHAGHYPLMQPRDAVKLIYQNEFGGGHLITDEAACLNYLQREYAGVAPDSRLPLYEQIGNGMIRVNLAAVKPEELGPLGKAFIRSAAEHTGTLDCFLQKLEVLRQLATEGVFSFSPAELEEYLSEYRAAGCPIVSHSDCYRQAYHPAYRVVCMRK